jgi:hypothetical protein
MYVFDTSPLSTLFKNYYPKRFPSLWKHFDGLVASNGLVSTREAFREIGDGPVAELRQWAESNHALFATPTAAEGAFVVKIYGVQHFHQNLEQQKLLKGGRNADPFIIARAAVEERTVVTMELLKPKAAKIPNICNHFGIPCIHSKNSWKLRVGSFRRVSSRSERIRSISAAIALASAAA